MNTPLSPDLSVPEPKTDNSPIRALLVDDDEDAYFLIRRHLNRAEMAQIQIDWVSNYDKGLEAIKTRNHDVYLLDFRLGGQNGLKLLKDALALGINAPVIMLTGAIDPKIDMEAMRIGAADFLVKDKLDAIQLERSIRYSIQHFATLQALRESHERFRLLFERSMDAILIADDQGNLLQVNRAACELLGHSRNHLLGRQTHELLFAEPLNLDRLTDQTFGEISFIRPDSQRRVAEFSACRFAPNLNLSILRDVTERRILEKEVQEISEREQRRLGQDLHDGLGQTLTGIAFLGKVLQHKLTTKGLPEAEEAKNIVKLMNEAISQCREMARTLCPVVLEKNDIYAALQELSSNAENYFGINCKLQCDPELIIGDNATAIHLYRIAQEATTNAIKHGKAKKVVVSLKKQRDHLTLTVKDDGVGFPKVVKSKGMGLRVMEYRARVIGATVEVDRGPHGGTIVTCKIENFHSGNPKEGAAQGTPSLAERP